MILRLRGHHLLCILGFRGLGYSDEFVANMRLIADRVLGGPETMLELVVDCDAICRACPHRRGRRCVKSPRVERSAQPQDRRVLAQLGLPPGARLTAGEALKRVAGLVSIDDLEQSLCPRCSWRALGCCAAGLAALKARLRGGEEKHET